MADILEELFRTILLGAGLSERQANKDAPEYAKVCRDIPLEVIKSVFKEYGIVPPEKFREAAIKKAMVRALKELLYAIEKLPAGDGFIVFADPRLPEFVELMGGMAEVRKMSPEDIRISLFKLYPELSPVGGIVCDAASSREKFYLLNLREKKLMPVTAEDVKLLEKKERRALGGGRHAGA